MPTVHFEEPAVSIEGTLQWIDHYRQIGNFRKAFELMRQIRQSFQVEVYWKLAQLCWESCNRNGIIRGESRDCLNVLFEKLEFNPACAMTHKSIALMMFASRREIINCRGIETIKKIRWHIEQAIFASPFDGYLFYMLGMFCFETAVAGLYFQRLCLKLSPSLPRGTMREALNHFETAITLMARRHMDCSGALLMAAQAAFRLRRTRRGLNYLRQCITNEERFGSGYKLNTRFARTCALVEGVPL